MLIEESVDGNALFRGNPEDWIPENGSCVSSTWRWRPFVFGDEWYEDN
jgi:hypothetical protein